MQLGRCALTMAATTINGEDTMGWTVYDRSMSREEATAKMRELHNWTTQDGATSYKVLADELNGGAYYAAVQIDEPGQRSRVFASVCLVTLCPFGYKDMSENMGPNECSASPEVLRLLSPLPPREPKPCDMCHGQGSFNDRRCFCCEGSGERDRHDYARNWRRRAWAKHGGAAMADQLDLLASVDAAA